MRNLSTLSDFRAFYDRVHAVQERRRRVALAAIHAAGLDGPGHMHNYFCSVEAGRPWPEIDQSKARKARRMWETVFTCSDLLKAASARYIAYGRNRAA